MARKRKRPHKATLEAAPTPQRVRMAESDLAIGDDRQGTKTLRIMDAPLEQAYHRGYIGDECYWVGFRWRQHWYLAGLAGGPSAIDYGRVHNFGFPDYANMPKTETQAHHRAEYRVAYEYLGPMLANFTERVVCYEVPLITAGHALGYGRRERALHQAKLRLRQVLGMLSKLWG